jgi:hypothetical protein
MLIAAWVVEARDVYLYIRDEYAECDHADDEPRASRRPACSEIHAFICAAAPAPISAAKNPR